VILKWAGNTAGVSQALSLSSSGQSHATATFAGLNFAVPKNDSADIDVYVTIPKIDDGAHTGAAISAVIDYNEGFKATDSAGSPTTSVGSADLNSAASSGYGTVYVKKSVPTLTRLATGYTSGDDTVAAGAGLYRFTIAADSNGAIEWRKISFAVATSGASFTNFTLYDVTGSATAVNSSAVAAVNTSGNVVIYVDTVNSNTVHSVSSSGGAKTYELRAAAVTGWGDAGDSVTVSFTEDTSAVVAQSSAALSDNMIWSDRASTSHTTITSDWTNGYLVKDVTNDTRTCQYGTATNCTP
jgi:hypothetical protein